MWCLDLIGCWPILSVAEAGFLVSLGWLLIKPLFYHLSTVTFMPLLWIIILSHAPKEFSMLLLSSCTLSPTLSTGDSNTQLVCWPRLVLAWVSWLLHRQEFCQLECVHHGNRCALLQRFFLRASYETFTRVLLLQEFLFSYFLDETNF